MIQKPVRQRRAARLDLDRAIFHYVDVGGVALGERFVGAVDDAIRLVSEGPGTGSPLWGERLKIDNLRGKPVQGFLYRIFYVERTDYIELLRILHAQSDIGAELNKED